MQRHGPLILQVFESNAAGHVKGNEFIRQRLAFRRRQGHLTHFERIPNFTREPEFIAQSLQDSFDASQATRDKDAMNTFLALALKKSNRITNFGCEPHERIATYFSHSRIA